MLKRSVGSISIAFTILLCFIALTYSSLTFGQVTLEEEIKISEVVMYFGGAKVPLNTTENSTAGYDFVYGRASIPNGDCVKS